MLVTVLESVGWVANEVQKDRKQLPMLLTVLGSVGGVVRDVQPDRKE
jgi:hypothetical protein